MKFYLAQVKNKADNFIMKREEESMFALHGVYGKLTNFDIIMMTIRHIQHHIGYCNSTLRQQGAKTIDWVGTER